MPQESGGLPVERFGEVEMVAVVHSAQQLGDGGQFGDPPAVGVQLVSELLVYLAGDVRQQDARAVEDRGVVAVRCLSPRLVTVVM